ncbi:hypothetical protein [Nocardia sp. NPDC127526]|uniref:hypothetical protein n=1 Tax=Nocardia sp. NPDC127526 TaxID=3345393 RepID=UPI00362ED8AB
MMRIRAALVGAGIAIAGLTALGGPAQAGPEAELGDGWRYIGSYTTNSRCIDAGQQFQREGAIREWRCQLDTGSYPPYILHGR